MMGEYSMGGPGDAMPGRRLPGSEPSLMNRPTRTATLAAGCGGVALACGLGVLVAVGLRSVMLGLPFAAAAILAILLGTPLAGLAFDLPGDGRVAFAAIAGLSAASLVELRRAPL